jgi:hypothetical protein
MPYAYVEPSIYLEHKGVEVFHVYRDGTDEPWSYWFTTNPKTADDCHAHGEGGHFDARMLARQWSETPSVRQWDDWWRPRHRREDEAIEALIRKEIDAGLLPKPIPTGE